MKEIKLNKTQFAIFNDNDQFQLFCDEDGFPDFEDFDLEVENLYKQVDCIIVTENDYIYAEKNNERVQISSHADQGFMIALQVVENFK